MVSPHTSTSDFLKLIAAEERLPADRMQGITKKLVDEWYDSVASMQHITLDQLSAMGIPSRVSAAILRKLKSFESSAPLTCTEALTRLAKELQGPGELQECVRTLQAIVYNLVTNPHDPRLREIRVTNDKFQGRVGRFPTAMTYLSLIGFKPLDDRIQVSTVDVSLFMTALRELNAYGVRLGLPEKLPPHMVEPEEFNPYKAVTTWCDPSLPKLIGRENDPTVYTAQIDELMKAKEEVLRRERVERGMAVYRLVEGMSAQSIRRINENTPETPADQDGDTPEDDSLMLQTMQSLLRANEENSRFQNKRKKVLEQLSRKKVFTKVKVQVRFPDCTLIQGYFSPLETNFDLYQFVHDALDQRNRKFSLYFTPPKVEVVASKGERLESMAPASLLYFAWKQEEETTAGDGPFLKGEMLARAVPLQ